MKASRLSRWCAISMAMLLALGLSTAPLLAAPLFLHPGGTHPPGFVTHLAPLPPAPLVPAGAAVGPIPYGDLLLNPLEPHHLEIELHNPTAIPASFNVAITYPGGAFPLTGIALPPGASVYWDIHYSDLPPEIAPVGFYSFFATNPDILSPLLTVTASVIEYPFPIFLAPAGPLFAPAGMVLPAPLIGVAPVLITVVPEPATAVLAVTGLAMVMVLKLRGHRRSGARKGMRGKFMPAS